MGSSSGLQHHTGEPRVRPSACGALGGVVAARIWWSPAGQTAATSKAAINGRKKMVVEPRQGALSVTYPCTNNVAYEAICKGMELLLKPGQAVELFGDSKLVISQLTEEYKCESESLFPLWMQCRELMTQFRYINFNWIPRSQNTEANDLAQMASGYKDVADGTDFQVQFMELDDWRADIFNYLKDSARGAPKRIRYKAMKYVLIGDDMFYSWKGYFSNVWDQPSPIGSYMTYMKVPVERINRLIR
ncbi:hypothetical protein QYE76_023002 [Lolium multiflorum]|uniref:RNase H type-1 domain-containing protein n=1 Tax=Lolium multiflorum TaxID=4521 RepID=A0AAD8RAV6_LOLMU|nr:hypothetical protein QYE76_023002 [Lolium multiflorum]